MGIPLECDDEDEWHHHGHSQTAVIKDRDFSSRLIRGYTSPKTTSTEGRLWVPYKASLFCETGLSSSSQRQTSPIKWPKGINTSLNSKEWLLTMKVTVGWAACPSCRDGLSEPTLPRSESLDPLGLPFRGLVVVSQSFSHSGTKRSPTSGPPATLVLESRPGPAR